MMQLNHWHTSLKGDHTLMADEREIRLQRLQALRDQGINPYPNSVERSHTIAEILRSLRGLGRSGWLLYTGRSHSPAARDGQGGVREN